MQDGASSNPFDCDLFVDGVAVDGFTFSSAGPEPRLGSGDLPKGRQAKGWLLYEVPTAGQAILSYKGAAPATTLRSSKWSFARHRLVLYVPWG